MSSGLRHFVSEDFVKVRYISVSVSLFAVILRWLSLQKDNRFYFMMFKGDADKHLFSSRFVFHKLSGFNTVVS